MRLTSSVAALVAAGALCLPAAAFDCAKASTDTEKAICADPAAKAADDAMSAAYAAVLPKLDAAQAKALKANQLSWLKSREEYCSADEKRGACLTERTNLRTAFLAATAQSGPGLATPVLPYIVSNKQTKTACSAEAAVHKFAAPATAGETAFNSAIDKLIAATAAENGAREVTPDYEYDCTWSLDAEITYASPELIAEVVNIYTFGGGAHGNYARLPVVVDLKSGKQPTFSDVFPEAAKAKIIEACTAGLRAEKVKRYSDIGDPDYTKELVAGLDESMKEYTETIAQKVADFSSWILYADRAEVYFAPYDVGAYAEGDFVCPLPKALLQQAAGPNGWLLP